ncbi:MAG TPA: hypothetical protein VF736_07695 [Pyrinomonadaceae bacterium]|jgi:hypothetical protein
MKGRIFVAVILVAAAAAAGRRVNTRSGPRPVASEREETHQTFRLGPGARVEVGHINGTVEVRTADTDVAEVHVVRTGTSAEALEHHRVTVECSGSYLSVRGERGGADGLLRWLMGDGGQVRQEVTLVLPRRVELSASHVNGAVRVGEVDGSVEVSHVNGRVEVAGAAGRAEVSHVNGGVGFGVARLGSDGLEISHVNGNIQVRFRQAVDADVAVEHQNGGLSVNVPNVTMQERLNRSNARLRFGAGGAPVRVGHVNGNVRFESDSGAAAQAVTVENPAEPAVPPAPPVPPVPPAE